jgi:hypothetical protein
LQPKKSNQERMPSEDLLDEKEDEIYDRIDSKARE